MNWVIFTARGIRRPLALFFYAILCVSIQAADASYRLKRLPLPHGTVSSRADSINAKGEILVDALTRRGVAQAQVLRGKKFTTLGSLPGFTNTSGQNISDSGLVIGSSVNGDSDHATFFYYDGVIHPVTSDQGFVQLFGVTSNNVVLGTINSSRPFLATNGVITFLDLPNGFPLSINNAGVLAGTAYVTTNSDSQLRAAFFVGTNVTFIPTDTIGDGNSVATALNDAGHVIGVASSNGVNRAFLFRDGVTSDLGLLEGWNGLYPAAINSRDQIVGFAVNGPDSSVAPFLWEAGELINLSQFVRKHQGTIAAGQSIDINDAGTIVTTLNKNGRTRAVLLTPKTPRH